MSEKMPSSAPAIDVRDLRKSYPVGFSPLAPFFGGSKDRLEVLKGVDLRIERGEVFGLLGPNGAGKSTVLKILATLVLPDDGTARVMGFDVVREGREVRGQVGVMLEQERSFFGRLTGRQNLDMFAALNNLFGHAAKQRIEEVLETTGLADAADRRFLRYSTGMQHRLGLARALLIDPPILLLDEPTRSLDPDGARQLGLFLRERVAHRHGKTILLLSHDLTSVEQICDRIGILSEGRIAAQGRPVELFSQFGSSTVSQLYEKVI